MQNDPERRRAAIEFVKLGYADLTKEGRFWSHNFRTAELPTELTQELVRLVPSFNAFDGAKVASALERFKGKVSGYEFGREGSPVLYIRLPHWTHQCEGMPPLAKGTRIDERETQVLMEQLRSVFLEELGAEEFDLVLPASNTFRVWWD